MSNLDALILITKFKPDKSSNDLIFDYCTLKFNDFKLQFTYYHYFHSLAFKNFSKKNNLKFEIYFNNKLLIVFDSGKIIKKEINKYLSKRKEDR